MDVEASGTGPNRIGLSASKIPTSPELCWSPFVYVSPEDTGFVRISDWHRQLILTANARLPQTNFRLAAIHLWQNWFNACLWDGGGRPFQTLIPDSIARFELPISANYIKLCRSCATKDLTFSPDIIISSILGGLRLTRWLSSHGNTLSGPKFMVGPREPCARARRPIDPREPTEIISQCVRRARRLKVYSSRRFNLP